MITKRGYYLQEKNQKSYGYSYKQSKLFFLKRTFLKSSNLDDEINDPKILNQKVDVYEGDNHIIILSKNLILVETKDNCNYLKDYEKGLEIIRDIIILRDDTKSQSIKFELTTEDYIRKIIDIDKYYKNLKIEEYPKEKYNIERDNYNSSMLKEQDVEFISTCFNTKYFNELKACYVKEEDFSTAEYYDKRIGRVIINIQIYYFNSQKFLKSDIIRDINNLKKKSIEILFKSFKDEYIKKFS